MSSLKKAIFDFAAAPVSVAMKVQMLKSIYIQPNRVLLAMLRTRRQRCGIPQHELARRLGKEQSFVSKIERGERRLDVIELKAWLEAMDVDVLVFLHELIQELAAVPGVDPRLATGRRSVGRRGNSAA